MREALPAPLAEAFGWIEGFTNFERRTADNLRPFRLDRMRFLAGEFGDPQESFSIIHVAGSKGKGSTCAFAGSILREAGYRTGVYASPHVQSYRERFMLDGEYLPGEILLDTINRIRGAFRPDWFGDGSNPTTFELLTLTALLAFREAGCQWAVLETGLGGRLDATNIVNPEISVITSIELEHTRLLGNSIAEVAAEKGGIIKQGIPVLLGDLNPEAFPVLTEIADKRRSPLFRLTELRVSPGENETVEFQLPGGPCIHARPGIPGRHQGMNAALAARAIQLTAGKEGNIPAEVYTGAIESTRLPGRFETVRSGDRIWIYDGAHTPRSAEATAALFRTRHPEGGVLLFAIAEDKDVEGVVAALPDGLSRIVVTRPGTFRASRPDRVHELVSRNFPGTELIPDTEEAVRRVQELASPHEPILVMGSFYLIGAVKEVQDF